MCGSALITGERTYCKLSLWDPRRRLFARQYPGLAWYNLLPSCVQVCMLVCAHS